jgi:hypothetical protein
VSSQGGIRTPEDRAVSPQDWGSLRQGCISFSLRISKYIYIYLFIYLYNLFLYYIYYNI